MKYIIGIDEAGRGPLAGPITLSAFVASENLRNKLIKILGNKIKDSKQFSPAKRYAIYRKLLRLRKEGKLFFSVAHVSNKIIDKRGISYATNLAIKRALVNTKRSASNTRPPRRRVGQVDFFEKNCAVRLDGLLKAPEEYKNQKTIIGGDGKDVFIACASIVAKVRRDRLMCRLSSKYPHYALEIHKGYGTKLHYSLLRKHGLSDIHRKSFLRPLLK
ncbi:MAG: ribonuclease HII [Candidatus Zambryskibacteria bacterium]